MKTKILSLLVLLLLNFLLKGQNIETDTSNAANLLKSGLDFMDVEKYDSAKIHLQNAAKIYEKHMVWERYLFCRQKEALTYRHTGHYQKSEQTALAAIEKTKGLVDTNETSLAYSFWTLARAYQMQKKYQEAMDYFNQALAILITKGEAEFDELADLFWFRAMIFSEQNEFQKVFNELNDALRFAVMVKPPNKGFFARIHYNLAYNFEKLNEFEKALLAYKACIDNNVGIDDNQMYTGWACDNSAIIYGKQKQFEKQMEFNSKAIEIYKKYKGEDYKYIGYCYGNIAWALESTGKYDSALIYRKLALVVYKYPFVELLPETDKGMI